MRRKLPPNVEKNVVKGHVYLSYRRGKGPRIRLPADPTSDEFKLAYAAAAAGEIKKRPATEKDAARSIGALVTSYLSSEAFASLGDGSKPGYRSRMDQIRRDHGHRAVVGLTKERIEEKILRPLHNLPGAKIDTHKKLKILIGHAIELKWLPVDPMTGIKRGKSKEIRAWTDAEMAAFEKRWPIGTKQRAAYELMLNVGTARVDVHQTTWAQVYGESFKYTRRKTGVPVDTGLADTLKIALDALPRKHVCILTTEYGKPFTIDGFSGWMRDAMTAAGLPKDCRPHGLRKTLGRRLADRGQSAHDIMAALGHRTLGEAERYTREANRRLGAHRAIASLNDHKANEISQTASDSLGKQAKTGRKST